MDATIIWDLEDDNEGNVQHLREHGVTIEEAEEVLLDPGSSRAVSRSSVCRLRLAGLRPADTSPWFTNWWTKIR
ncbi:MAG TPA: hypothetical protein VGY66_20025 [Gemmataceae bacterium]|jgi:uncharacterized DUF497 family protein|nr:hypothetical protein [Gemmataceae bacterium]